MKTHLPSWRTARTLLMIGTFAYLPLVVHASTLLLNFAPSANPVTNVSPGFDATVSPGHAVGAVPGTDTTWNNIQTGDVASGLLFGDGTSAAGISLDLGSSAVDSDVIDFSSNPANVGLGSGLLTGIYSGTRPSRYGIWSGSGNVNVAVGLRIDGLDAGIYRLYFVGRNTNNNDTTMPQRFYVEAGSSSSTFDFSGVSNFDDVTADPSSPFRTAFFDGINYGTLDITIADGESLFFATEGITSAGRRGFLNSLEIVTIPEPSSLGLLFATGIFTVLLRRKR